MTDAAERETLLENARRARRLASSLRGDEPAAKELLELAAEYEARAARTAKAPPLPQAPTTQAQVSQQQQQPQPDSEKNDKGD